MKKSFLGLKFVFFVIILAVSSSLVFASELLLFSEEELVVTASRHEQKISEAPSAITVITAEDIHQSGATNIPDVLRMVPGLDVMFLTALDPSICARGLNHRLSNKVLLLIDGRPSYLKLLGNIFWEAFSISLEEIERIEIIRGPGSVLYGTNAYCGVIHIITKSAEELKGTGISFTAGNYNTYLGSLIHAGEVDKLDYKLSLGWYQTDQWTKEKEHLDGIPRGNMSLGYKLNDTSKIALSGGHGEIEGEMAAGDLPMEKDGEMNYLQLNYELGSVKFLTYWEEVNGETINKQTLIKDKQHTDTYELEMQHSLNLFKTHSIIWGGSLRKCDVESGMIKDGKKSQDTWAFYLQDEFKPRENFSIVVGGRNDYHPLYGNHTTPRASVVYSPIKKHTFRVSAATAFRAPTFFESYLDLVTSISIPAISPSFHLLIPVQGIEDLEPEKITSYEMGYYTFLMDRIKGRIDLFYNQYKDFIEATYELYGTEEILPGIPGGTLPKRYYYHNIGKTDARGGEISLDLFINKWLTGMINYSCQKIVSRADIPDTVENDENKRKKESPLNKANVGLKFKFENGLSLNILAHYVDSVEWWDYQELDPYTIVNVRLGYKFTNNIEIAAAVFNLFNDEHYEYTPGNLKTLVFGEKIARKITGNINYKF